MRYDTQDTGEPIFNDIRIDLRGNNLNTNQHTTENDQRSNSSIPSRISRFSEYPQVRPTNPLYSSQSIFNTQGFNPLASVAKSSATLVNRRQKFDPQAPRRPSDWRWLAVLCIMLFFPTGLLAFAFSHKAQIKFRNGFIIDSNKLNNRALILCIISILCGITLIIGLLFGFDAWPRTNG
ncbi:unnamed protein product [Rotaria magnacalcarata]|uniref:Uncharacterized protein n=1 Tax=Rotaria magnacalcarata TaxID=392030 RepID=A0A819F0D3_9BILA|nr:unnamed protein product [Rotaria magnacalcarata]CAF1523555.1 unnamed protein product [Rotaria magnacalcarata]CAF2054156.1 unnamed protein product [Rotaria magnacalcarata]CAF2089880.1 unnamed protein product [Rotaria magnacalcarata]CAF2145026.1 unnamed protein product [Rotaria magnacalcarata]